MDNGIKLSSLAQKELKDAYEWYENQLNGLGARFAEVIYGSIISISSHPKFYPRKKGNFREFVVDKFPYIIVYEILEEEAVIIILHIFHTSRNPRYKYKKK